MKNLPHLITSKKDTDKRNEIFTFKEKYERRFYKGIHLKGEIGFFAYWA